MAGAEQQMPSQGGHGGPLPALTPCLSPPSPQLLHQMGFCQKTASGWRNLSKHQTHMCEQTPKVHPHSPGHGGRERAFLLGKQVRKLGYKTGVCREQLWAWVYIYIYTISGFCLLHSACCPHVCPATVPARVTLCPCHLRYPHQSSEGLLDGQG